MKADADAIIDQFGKNEQIKKVFWTLFISIAGLFLAQVLDPATAQQIVGMITGCPYRFEPAGSDIRSLFIASGIPTDLYRSQIIHSITMVNPAVAEQIFDLVIRIQLREKKMLELNFSPHHIRVLLPPKRVLALSGEIPMSRITAVLSEMEQDQLIQGEQRGGMWATPRGNRIIADCLAGKYRKEAEALLGPVVLETLLQRLFISGSS